MKFIEATWDTKTLGLPTYEIILESGDKLNDLKRIEDNFYQDYHITVKTPVGIPDFLYSLKDYGYVFVETNFDITLHKKNYIRPKIMDRFESYLQVKKIDIQTDYERIFENISHEIFTTDRISLNPNFSFKDSNKRYINWIKALKLKGESLFEILFRKAPIGFFVTEKIDNNSVGGVLSGLYKQSTELGLGLVLMAKEREMQWQLNYSKYLTSVASNNPQALRSNLHLGGEIVEMNYVYSKTLINKSRTQSIIAEN